MMKPGCGTCRDLFAEVRVDLHHKPTYSVLPHHQYGLRSEIIFSEAWALYNMSTRYAYLSRRELTREYSLSGLE